MSKYIVEMDDDHRCDYSFYNEEYSSGALGEYICLRSDRCESCEGDLKKRPEWCDLEKFVAYPTKIDNHPFILGEKDES